MTIAYRRLSLVTLTLTSLLSFSAARAQEPTAAPVSAPPSEAAPATPAPATPAAPAAAPAPPAATAAEPSAPADPTPTAAVMPKAVAAPAAPVVTLPEREPEQFPVVEEPEPEPDEDAPALQVGLGIRTGIGIGFDPTVASITDGFMGPGNVGGNEALVRPYFSGQLNKYIGFSANFEAYASGTDGPVPIRVLDAIVQLHFDDLFNVWVGQFLPPQDRAALDGPYYLNTWNYPIQVAGFPFDVAARDRGFAIWGQINGGMFKYQLAAVDLQTGVRAKNIRYAGRLVLNLLDPEPGYYNSSTYYGEKDVFAIGVSGAAQPAKNVKSPDGSGTIAEASSYGFQADVLFEKNLKEAGVLTLEGSYWLFDNDPGYVTNPGGAAQGGGLDPTYGSGNSFFVLASWLTPNEVGIGKLQPGARLQWRKPKGSDAVTSLDVTLGYIIDGHKNKLYLGYQHVTPSTEGVDPYDAAYLGFQLQI